MFADADAATGALLQPHVRAGRCRAACGSVVSPSPARLRDRVHSRFAITAFGQPLPASPLCEPPASKQHPAPHRPQGPGIGSPPPRAGPWGDPSQRARWCGVLAFALGSAFPRGALHLCADRCWPLPRVAVRGSGGGWGWGAGVRRGPLLPAACTAPLHHPGRLSSPRSKCSRIRFSAVGVGSVFPAARTSPLAVWLGEVSRGRFPVWVTRG